MYHIDASCIRRQIHENAAPSPHQPRHLDEDTASLTSTSSPSHIKSAEYENPRNSSCIACVKTITELANAKVFLKYSSLTRLYRGKHRRNTRKFRIKVARVCWTLDLRLERRRDFLSPEIIPVDVPKESMAHDFLSIGRSRSQSQFWLSHQQFL